MMTPEPAAAPGPDLAAVAEALAHAVEADPMVVEEIRREEEKPAEPENSGALFSVEIH